MKKISTPKIIWYTLCWNELPILPFVVDYWKQIADKVIVYDNNSTDGSIEFLRHFNWIEVRPYPYTTNNQLNDDINRRIKNECWKECQGQNDIDWVIVSDLDEVLWARKGNLKNELIKLKEQGVAINKPYSCDFICQDFPIHDNLLLHEKIKTYQHVNMWDKCIVFDPNLVKDINYGPGAHDINPVYSGVYLQTQQPQLLLFHFKYLSIDYLTQKRFATKPRMSDINKRNCWGYEYLYDRNQIENQFNSKWQEAKNNNIDDLLL